MDETKKMEMVLHHEAKMEFKNELATYKFGLTEIERNIVIALYSEIDCENTSSSPATKRIYFSDIAKVCGLTNKDYKKISKAVWSLFDIRSVKGYSGDVKRGMHWLVNVDINDKEHWFECDWNPKLVPFFLFEKHNGGFISSNRDVLINFKNVHTYRFYWWFKQWINTKRSLTFQIKEIADMLDLKASYYDEKSPNGVKAGQIKKDVIDKVLNDMRTSELCDIEADAVYNKNGRYIESVTFTYHWKSVSVVKPKAAVEAIEVKAGDVAAELSKRDEIMELLLSRKFSPQSAGNIIAKYPAEQIINNVHLAESQYKDSCSLKIIRAAIRDDYYSQAMKVEERERVAAEIKEAHRIACMTPEQRQKEAEHQEMLAMAAQMAADVEKSISEGSNMDREITSLEWADTLSDEVILNIAAKICAENSLLEKIIGNMSPSELRENMYFKTAGKKYLDNV